MNIIEQIEKEQIAKLTAERAVLAATRGSR